MVRVAPFFLTHGVVTAGIFGYLQNRVPVRFRTRVDGYPFQDTISDITIYQRVIHSYTVFSSLISPYLSTS